MLDWQNDFTYWYREGGNLIEAASLSAVPESIEHFAKIWEAVRFFEKCGCMGRSAHAVSSEYHALCLEVIKIAISRYGEEVLVFRGSQRESLPLEDHKILYGATDERVAVWYGPVSQFKVRGLRTNGVSASVLSPDDLSTSDEAFIFTPDTILCS